ncbi:hypothetical protein V8E52_008033 [Russula decolorans]|jgi:ribosomal protein L19
MLTINLMHVLTTFSGMLISVQCRGPDTSFVLQNMVQRTGIEMQFFVNSPHVVHSFNLLQQTSLVIGDHNAIRFTSGFVGHQF